MEYFPDTLQAFNIFQNLGYLIFVITNQSGVGRGFFSIDIVHKIHDQIQIDLKNNKLLPIKDFGICPHSPEDTCECRKPSGKMILEFITKYNISPTDSYMIGDKIIDAEAGKNAGIFGIIVRTDIKTDFPKFRTLLDFAHSLKK